MTRNSDLPALIIMLLFVGILLRVDFLFYIAYVCIGIFIWSRWVLPRQIDRLVLRRHYSDHAFWGQRVNVSLTLTNRSRLPIPWLHFQESIPARLRTDDNQGQVVTIRGHRTVSHTYAIKAQRRGYYQIGPTIFSLGDTFGFDTQQGRFETSYLTVYPRIIPIRIFRLSSRLPFGTVRSKQRLFEDPARTAGVRDFQSGDSLRQINWKVSARYNGHPLQVRTYEPAISLDTVLLLNLNVGEFEDRYHAPEWCIEVAASLAAHLVEMRQAVGLITNGSDPLQSTTQSPQFDSDSGRLILHDRATAMVPHPVPIAARSGRRHLMKVLELLARIETHDRTEFSEWIPRACLGLSWGITIVAITPRADAPMCNALHRLLRAGYNPVLVVGESVIDWKSTRERAQTLGYQALLVRNQSDLERWQAGPDLKNRTL